MVALGTAIANTSLSSQTRHPVSRLGPSLCGSLILSVALLGCTSPEEPTTRFWRLTAQATGGGAGCFLQIYSMLDGMESFGPWEGRAQIGFLRAQGSSGQWQHVADTTLNNVVVRVEPGNSDSLRVLIDGSPADTLVGTRTGTEIGGSWRCDGRWPASGGDPLSGVWSLFLDLPPD